MPVRVVLASAALALEVLVAVVDEAASAAVHAVAASTVRADSDGKSQNNLFFRFLIRIFAP